MHYSKHIAILFALIFAAVLAIGVASCGKHTTSECTCELCVDDAPAYPCDSEASCTEYAKTQDCHTSNYYADDTETCGGEAQPACEISGCTGQCTCPGVNPDISSEYDEYDEYEEE